MSMQGTKKTLAALLLAVLLGCLLALPGLAASGDITQQLRECLQTELASITLYSPTESFSSCGAILYSDETGEMQLSVSGEETAPIESVTVSTQTVYTPREASEDGEQTDEWDGETPYVKDGYVLVVVRAEGLDDYTACLDESCTLTADERAAQREAEAAAELETEETSEEQTETVESETTEPATPTPLALTEETAIEKLTLAERIDALSSGELVLLIALMVLIAAVLAELLLLLLYKRRAENLARSLLRGKAALDSGKRELAAARTKNMRLERELLQEREKMAAVRDELEKLRQLRSRNQTETPKNPPEPPAENTPENKTGYDLDYLNWMQ